MPDVNETSSIFFLSHILLINNRKLGLWLFKCVIQTKLEIEIWTWTLWLPRAARKLSHQCTEQKL